MQICLAWFVLLIMNNVKNYCDKMLKNTKLDNIEIFSIYL